jgi:L-2-hydroxyglutarate oxidase
MVDFCRQLSIPHEICGKLVVACSAEEIPRLRELLDRGTRNGLKGLRWLERDQMREIEPHAGGLAAVHVPEEGIVDYPAVCRTLKTEIESRGGRVLTGCPVRGLQPSGSEWVIAADCTEQKASFLFNCAGLQCDLVMAMAGEPRRSRIVPFRGEYYELNERGRLLVRNLIYPVPDPKFPFLGVHFTRMIHGGVEAGPNAVLAFAREGYRKRDISPRDLADVFGYSGFWRFLMRYPRMCAYELHRSFSRREFCRSLQRLVPELELTHLSEGGSGIRAQALSPDGTLVQDFEYVLRPNALHLMNAPSPGATASLAIAGYLLDVAAAAA